ncbi:hypothetical protein F5Y19DRAFT_363986 [Xylariaceae sp. FL1651]|nr:hypothetical protein F5Y19DRAFT_363986 [Xylariaceae sp. FL1651]
MPRSAPIRAAVISRCWSLMLARYGIGEIVCFSLVPRIATRYREASLGSARAIGWRRAPCGGRPLEYWFCKSWFR